MRTRISQKMLENKADYLNEILGRPIAPWRKDKYTGEYKANIGNYHISYAYGGACLHEMTNEGGGVSCPIVHGHVPKRELFGLMDAFIAGITRTMNVYKQEVDA